MPTKPGNTCTICGTESATSTDHMIHVTTTHGVGTPTTRPSSCWSCAAECDPTGLCECGWQHPHYLTR